MNEPAEQQGLTKEESAALPHVSAGSAVWNEEDAVRMMLRSFIRSRSSQERGDIAVPP